MKVSMEKDGLSEDQLINTIQKNVDMVIQIRGRLRRIDDLLDRLSLTSVGLGSKWRAGELRYYNGVRESLQTEYGMTVASLGALIRVWQEKYPQLESPIYEAAVRIWMDAQADLMPVEE